MHVKSITEGSRELPDIKERTPVDKRDKLLHRYIHNPAPPACRHCRRSRHTGRTKPSLGKRDKRMSRPLLHIRAKQPGILLELPYISLPG